VVFAQADASGNWSNVVPSDKGLADGSRTITAKAQDSAGNLSDASAAYEVIVDTTPLTLAITDNEAAASKRTVAGTEFTFTFNKAVTDFDINDVAVTGGTAGTWTQVDATTYRLTVAPTLDTQGQMGVSVAGNTQFAGVGALSAAASQTQAYDLRAITSQGNVLATFNGLSTGTVTSWDPSYTWYNNGSSPGNPRIGLHMMTVLFDGSIKYTLYTSAPSTQGNTGIGFSLNNVEGTFQANNGWAALREISPGQYATWEHVYNTNNSLMITVAGGPAGSGNLLDTARISGLGGSTTAAAYQDRQLVVSTPTDQTAGSNYTLTLSGGSNWQLYKGTTLVGSTAGNYTVTLAELSTLSIRTFRGGSAPTVTATLVAGTTPLALDLDGDGVQTLGLSAGVAFDMDADGTRDHTGWVGPRDGLLALDRNRNGTIDNASELFGQSTPMTAGGVSTNGFGALAQYDENGDRVIDAQDAVFQDLRVWVDANSNGLSDEGELQTLAELGISSLNLNFAENDAGADAQGNSNSLVSTYTTEEGQTLALDDMYFVQGTQPDFVGSEYDDTFLVQDAAFVQADGGAGIDTLQLTGAEQVLDLTSLFDNQLALRSIEVVDLTGTGNNTLRLSMRDVLEMGSSNVFNVDASATDTRVQLMITGDSGDVVQLTDLGSWTQQSGSFSDAGATYNVYNNGNAQLLIDQNMVPST
jgi:hypothetical protein